MKKLVPLLCLTHISLVLYASRDYEFVNGVSKNIRIEAQEYLAKNQVKSHTYSIKKGKSTPHIKINGYIAHVKIFIDKTLVGEENLEKIRCTHCVYKIVFDKNVNKYRVVPFPEYYHDI
jgi:DNA-directed RNA polymerase subunit RPC12/RpoP